MQPRYQSTRDRCNWKTAVSSATLPIMANVKKGLLTAPPEWWKHLRWVKRMRDGLVRPRRSALARALFTSQPPHAGAGASALDALIEERRNGR